MDISHETYRTISHDFGFSVDSLKRHKANHLTVDLGDVYSVMVNARKEALAEVREKGLEETKTEIANTISGRLEQAKDFFEQLKVLRERAALTLEKAEASEDLKAALLAIRELRETVRIWAELEGKLQVRSEVNVLVNHPEWVELRTTIINALEGYPEAREKVVDAISG